MCPGVNKTQGHCGAYEAIEEVVEESGIERDEHRGNSWGRRGGENGQPCLDTYSVFGVRHTHTLSLCNTTTD